MFTQSKLDPSCCAFGAEVILKHLRAFIQEVDGVRHERDVECVHRMRVASRRLRGALALFDACLPRKRRSAWRKQIRRARRALGAARDVDVQLEFLQRFRSGLGEARHRAGVDRMRLRLRRGRQRLQAKVAKAVDRFVASGVAQEIEQSLEASLAMAGPGPPYAPALFEQAYQAISSHLQTLLAHEPYVYQPERVQELHSMRIEAKRLRYAMEVFAPLYEGELNETLQLVRDVQEMLGDIHDCDVWVGSLPRFLEEERARTLEYFGHVRPFKRLEAGLVRLQEDRQQHRLERYRQFVEFWVSAQKREAWRNLLQTLRAPLGATSAAVPAQAALGGDPNREVSAALIGDVHANLPALEAVLAHAQGQGVEAVWNVGDFVGYGAFPDEVVGRLRQDNALSIAGNYDRKVLRVPRKERKWRERKAPQKLAAFKWAYDNLSPENRAYLRSLPKEIRLQVAGKRLLFTHGSPDSDREPLGPATPEDRLRELAAMAEADVVICGHSHQPFAREVDGVWFINPGSVGRPDDGDPRASYAVLRIGPQLFEAYHFRVEYNVGRAADAIRERGLPEPFARMVLEGRDLDSVGQGAPRPEGPAGEDLSPG